MTQTPASSNVMTSTRERILVAAVEEFGEKGFAAATVRAICSRAKANVAAVNYHFQDKQALYAAVLETIVAEAFEQYPADKDMEPDKAPRQRLQAFVRNALMRFLHKGDFGGNPHALKLIHREVMDPSPAMEKIIFRYFVKVRDQLHGLIRDYLGQDARPELVMRCSASIMAQCNQMVFANKVISRMHPGIPAPIDDVHGTVDHIVAFSLGGLEQTLAREQGNTTPTTPL
ncbi:MAG: TetR/AcrR family transcriptional regulator [Desulfovibrio sp.]|nr:MAG: TetR/AcrR family transcriptional regulator [Desulfovibrio sp.]